MEGISLDAEAGAEAADIDDLFERLEASGRLVRIDPSWPATMYRGTMLSARELRGRCGRSRTSSGSAASGGSRPTGSSSSAGRPRPSPDVLHVDCTALGLRDAPATPIFQPGRIVLQQVRHLSPSFNAALIGFVEAHRDDDADKNRLCPPNPYPSSIEDWPRMISRTWRTEQRWLSEPDLSALGGREPAQPAARASRPRSPSRRPGGDRAISHSRRGRDRAAHATGRIALCP